MLGFECDSAVTPIDDVPDACKLRIGSLYDVHDLEDRSSGCYHVLDDQNALARVDLKPAPKVHFSILPLGEDRPGAQHTANLRAHHDAPDGG